MPVPCAAPSQTCLSTCQAAAASRVTFVHAFPNGRRTSVCDEPGFRCLVPPDRRGQGASSASARPSHSTPAPTQRPPDRPTRRSSCSPRGPNAECWSAPRMSCRAKLLQSGWRRAAGAGGRFRRREFLRRPRNPHDLVCNAHDFFTIWSWSSCDVQPYMAPKCESLGRVSERRGPRTQKQTRKPSGPCPDDC